MHAGLLRAEGVEYDGMAEAMQAPIALVFDYEAEWAWAIQPHGDGLSYFGLVFEAYRALRSHGLPIDVLPARDYDLSGNKMVLAPGLMDLLDVLKRQLTNCAAPVILGPRSGACNEHMSTPVPMPPAVQGLDLTVSHVESLPPNQPIFLPLGGHITEYREFVETSSEVLEQTTLAEPVLVAHGNLHYLIAWLDQAALTRILKITCKAAGIETVTLPNGVRRRETRSEVFWFNYDNAEHTVEGLSLKPISTLRETK